MELLSTQNSINTQMSASEKFAVENAVNNFNKSLVSESLEKMLKQVQHDGRVRRNDGTT